jgi:hypothetical protein
MPPLTGSLIPEPTADGSFTLFSEDFGEWFHSREGAYTEAYTTYVQATDLVQLAQAGQITLLDVCYGLGYNSAAALATLHQVNPQVTCHLVGLELVVCSAPGPPRFSRCWSNWPESVPTSAPP